MIAYIEHFSSAKRLEFSLLHQQGVRKCQASL